MKILSLLLIASLLYLIAKYCFKIISEEEDHY